MLGLDLATLDSMPLSHRAECYKLCRFGQSHPFFCCALHGVISGDVMVAAQCGDPLTSPTITPPSQLAVAIERASDDVIGTSASEHADSLHRVVGSVKTVLTATTPWNTQLGV